MEYYTYITYQCNLSCSYCSARKLVSTRNKSVISEKQIDKLINYISSNNSGDDTLVFFGGEPLLEPRVIYTIIQKTSHLNLSYILYTNGLLLDKTPLNILNSLDVIFVSIDGDRTSHEKHRGLNTYDKIIENIKTIKPKLKGKMIGRLTIEEDTNVYLSVTNILDHVDGVYWQIVNKSKFVDSKLFIDRYKQGITHLFNFWLKNFKKGTILNIIPFQAVISSMVYGYKKDGKSFRCGAGYNYQAIDVNGNVYWCDEYVGDQKGVGGNINNGDIIRLPYKAHIDIFEDCKNCEVSNICLGRCRKCLEEYSIEQKRTYCSMTKYMIRLISQHIGEINKIIRERNYTLTEFYSLPYCTEEIP